MLLPGRVRRFPVARKEFGKPVHGMGGEAGEHVAQVSKGIDLTAVACRDHAESSGDTHL